MIILYVASFSIVALWPLQQNISYLQIKILLNIHKDSIYDIKYNTQFYELI